ncbi:hypothetical protein KKH46_00540 [Patescibacteria group bacterium]|nr:hypothetical protein [Patescibacteria group bacterium]
MSKHKHKKLSKAKRALNEFRKQEFQRQQLENRDAGFIVFIKLRIKKFLNLFSSLKIKSFKIDSKFKILNSKLFPVAILSIAILSAGALVYFFALAEPADQLPQNQTFLNLAHSHINASTTAPITYTSTSAQTTQADFEQTGSGGFGYSATTTPNSVVGNDDLGVYRSAPIDLGLKTKLANAVITKGGSARVFARSGNGASVSPVEVKRTTTAEFDAGLVKTNINTASNQLKATTETGGGGSWDLSTALSKPFRNVLPSAK